MSLFSKLRLFFYISLLLFSYFVLIPSLKTSKFTLFKEIHSTYLSLFTRFSQKMVTPNIKSIIKQEKKISNIYPYFKYGKGIVLTQKDNKWIFPKYKEQIQMISNLEESYSIINLNKNISILLNEKTRIQINKNNCIEILTGCIKIHLNTLLASDICINGQNNSIYKDKRFCEGKSKTLDSEIFISDIKNFNAYDTPKISTVIVKKDWVGKNDQSTIILQTPRNESVIILDDNDLELSWKSEKGLSKCRVFIARDEMFSDLIYENVVRGYSVAITDLKRIEEGSFYWKLACGNRSSKTAKFYMFSSLNFHILEPNGIIPISTSKLPVKIRWTSFPEIKRYNLVFSDNNNFDNILKSINTSDNYVYVDRPKKGIYYIKVFAIFNNKKSLASNSLRIRFR